MAKIEYVINPVFNEILLKLGVKKKYIKNLKTYTKEIKGDIETRIVSLNRINNFLTFMSSSFVYNDTPEYNTDDRFWYNIAIEGDIIEKQILAREENKKNKG